jgi:hypothetical protein
VALGVLLIQIGAQGSKDAIFWERRRVSQGIGASIFIELLRGPRTAKELEYALHTSRNTVATAISRLASRLRNHKLPYAIGQLKIYGEHTRFVLVDRDKTMTLLSEPRR